MTRTSLALFPFFFAAPLAAQAVQLPDKNFDACTSIMVSSGASVDGSVMDRCFLRILHPTSNRGVNGSFSNI